MIRSRDHLSRDEFSAAITQIAADGGGGVRWFVCEPTPDEQSLAVEYGLSPSAQLLHMQCALPLAAPHNTSADFATRAFRPGIDDDEWLVVNARAFAAHPEQGDWNHEVLAARMKEHWFDAQGFLIHEIEGRIAGFCWTKVHTDHASPVGEIYVIGVDPAHHGGGLGRALAIAGFAFLAARGPRHGMLYVAGDNTAAIHLYESLGMTIAHRDDVFIGAVAAR